MVPITRFVVAEIEIDFIITGLPYPDIETRINTASSVYDWARGIEYYVILYSHNLLILTIYVEEGYIRTVAFGILRTWWAWRAWWTLLS